MRACAATVRAVLADLRPAPRSRRRPRTTTPTPAACSSTPSASRRSAARRRSSIRGCAASSLLAAALVHDVGRTLELGRGPAFAPTDEGRLLGHVHLGLRLIEERAAGSDGGAAGRAPPLRRGAPRRARRANGRGGRALPREPARRDRGHAPGRVAPARTSTLGAIRSQPRAGFADTSAGGVEPHPHPGWGCARVNLGTGELVDVALDVVAHALTAATGRPIGSGRFQSTYRFPGSTGQASSPQPIVTTTSAHSTSSCSIPRGLRPGDRRRARARLDDLRVPVVLRVATGERASPPSRSYSACAIGDGPLADADEVRASGGSRRRRVPTGPPSAKASSSDRLRHEAIVDPRRRACARPRRGRPRAAPCDGARRSAGRGRACR